MLVKHKGCIRMLLIGTLFLVFRLTDSSSCKCGRSNIARIVNGIPVDPSKHPWLVAINIYNNYWEYKCVGALIHPRWILTAAHCVYETQLQNCEATDSVQKECITSAKKIQIAFGSTQGKLQVSQIIVQDNFRPISLQYDIALLELQSEVKCNERVFPICLSKGPEMESPQKPVTLAGWGKTESGESSEFLRQTTMIVIPPGHCGMPESILCATGNNFNATSWSGDSGAPLVYADQNVHYTIGVLSKGFCKIGDIVYFARVSQYTRWISQYVNLREVAK